MKSPVVFVAKPFVFKSIFKGANHYPDQNKKEVKIKNRGVKAMKGRHVEIGDIFMALR